MLFLHRPISRSGSSRETSKVYSSHVCRWPGHKTSLLNILLCSSFISSLPFFLSFFSPLPHFPSFLFFPLPCFPSSLFSPLPCFPSLSFSPFLAFFFSCPETAINIGYSSKLLTEDMRVFIVDADDREGVIDQLNVAREEIESKE